MPQFDGRDVSYEEYRYLMGVRQRVVLEQVDTLATREALTVLEVGRDLGRQEMGGFLRNTMPPIVDKYGQINATAALDYYNETKAAWYAENPGTVPLQAGARRNFRQSRNARSARFASARLEAEIYVATRPEFDLTNKVDGIVNYAMKTFSERGFDAMRPSVTNSLTRALASYQRDTVLYNSALDSDVFKVQRVARPNACSFCRVVAFESYKGSDVRTTDYAVDFHDNCHCTIETLYLGDQPIRPDYYDTFERQYAEATQYVNSPDYEVPDVDGNLTGAKEIFSAMRQVTGAK
jgi:hypothetical protein